MWNEIENEIDIQNLMKEYFGFHDSCIVSISYHSGAFVDDKGAMGMGNCLSIVLKCYYIVSVIDLLNCVLQE